MKPFPPTTRICFNAVLITSVSLKILRSLKVRFKKCCKGSVVVPTPSCKGETFHHLPCIADLFLAKKPSKNILKNFYIQAVALLPLRVRFSSFFLSNGVSTSF